MIEAKSLTKLFGEKRVVDEVSFTVNKGEVLGFLGPNAAGKSTTMRMLTGFLQPSSGTALIGGSDIRENSLDARAKIGYLPENAPVYPDMPVTAFLEFCASIRGFSGAGKKKAVEATIEKSFLTEVRNQTVGTLSKGYKQRVCFAQSILHDPEYLIFDEPTDGLDPNQKHEVRTMITQMGQKKAIILSTHILEEVDAVCTRAIIIANGRIVADDTPEGLRAMSSVHNALSVTLLAPAGAEGVAVQVEKLPGVEKVRVMDSQDKRITLRVFGKKDEPGLQDQIVHYTAQTGLKLESLFRETGRLDEVFRNITTTNKQ